MLTSPRKKKKSVIGYELKKKHDAYNRPEKGHL